MKIGIWLDDTRNPANFPWIECWNGYGIENLVWVTTVEDFQNAVLRWINEGELCALFFDNDLGTIKEGTDAFNWFEELAHSRDTGTPALVALTSNPSARIRLTQGFTALENYWHDKETQ